MKRSKMPGVRNSALTVIVVLTGLLAGCGGKAPSAAKATRATCTTRLVAAAEANALHELFVAGKLGTSAEIRAETSKAHPFFSADGTMVPYSRMTPWQKAAFADWAQSPRVDRLARHELEDADRLALRQASNRCGG